ncbi:MAG: cupin domain-containing protein [Gloeomargaritaceae cyanobacterium C42_A2020_066]|nr:cupin domain-containing protein [Gloeomargaritaceae cyanobacterium C42_A2020_066]
MHRLALGLLLVLSLGGQVRAEEGSPVKVQVLNRTTTSWDGRLLPPYPAGQPEVTILRIVIPPGVQLPLHKHPVINAGMLLRGTLTVTTADQKVLHIKAGDGVVEVVDQWHFGKNDGTEPAEILVIYAGIQGQPVTINKE